MPEPFQWGRPVRLPSPPGYPPGWCYEQVRMPAAPGVDPVVGAAQLVAPGGEPDPDVARSAVVRHWAGEDHGQLGQVASTADALRADGARVVTLDEFVLHDPALTEQPGCPLVRAGDDTRMSWVRAERWAGGPLDSPAGETAWVPYSQCVVRWLDADPGQPVTHTMNMAGLGAARTRHAAVEAACADLVAQDAVVAWWIAGGEVSLHATETPEALTVAWGPSPLSLRLLELPSATGVPVCLAAVVDEGRRAATVGASAGPDAPATATAAALRQLIYADDLLDPTGDVYAAAMPGVLPHRPERDYLAAAGPGARRVGDPVGNLQLGLDPEVHERVVHRTSPHTGSPPRPWSGSDDTAGLLASVTDLWLVDLTTPDVARTGWHCVRMLAPRLGRIPVAGFPLDAADRPAEVATMLGWPVAAVERLPYPGW